jgi:two-component system, chemotaxis family, protein-glutamate methylesterase/glutaminase
MITERDISFIVIGASAGGGGALVRILAPLPEVYRPAIFIVQHLPADDEGGFARSLHRKTRLPVIEPCDKQTIEPGKIYVAPANYHMLVERTGNIALSVDDKVKWSRPSIDVLFQSAAYAWGEKVIAVLLTGANDDGVEGMRAVMAHGGLTIAQDPATAEYPAMPQSAITSGVAGKVLAPEAIGALLAACGRLRAQEDAEAFK